MKKTQLEWILRQLELNGFITRNQCLRRYISRLGARISDLKKEGYKFRTKYLNGRWGKDYVYFLIKKP
jgi:hypothetical protein